MPVDCNWPMCSPFGSCVCNRCIPLEGFHLQCSYRFRLCKASSGLLSPRECLDPLKMCFILNMGMFHCHVSLPEGITKKDDLFCWIFGCHNFDSSDILSSQHIKHMGDVDINLWLEPQSIRGPGKSKIIIHDRSMGLVYLPTFIIQIH